MENPQIIEFDGHKFRRSKTNPKYYYADIYNGTGKAGRKKKALHHAIWEKATGQKLEKGQCIHHRDGNTFNNTPENLERMHRSEHQRKHNAIMFANPEYRAQNKRHLEEMQNKAKDWHKSKVGRAWHKNHWHESIGKSIVPIEKVCKQCGKTYIGKQKRGDFCHNRCWQKHRRIARLQQHL